jgi:hypothetical protein
MSHPGLVVTIVFVAIPLLVFWFSQLFDLMRRRDDEFPGKLDKVAWVIIIVFTGCLGAFAYLLAKPAPSPTRGAPREDQQDTCLQCGQPMPEGTPICPSCGWSFESGE